MRARRLLFLPLLLLVPLGGLKWLLLNSTAPVTEDIGSFSDAAQGNAEAWQVLAADVESHPHARSFEVRFHDTHLRTHNTFKYYPRTTTLIRERASDFETSSSISESTTPQDVVTMAQQYSPGSLMVSSAHSQR